MGSKLTSPQQSQQWFRNTLSQLKTAEDLDKQRRKILTVLRRDGRDILGREPELLLDMVRNADQLIKSAYYVDIVQRMTDIYKNLPQKLNEEPLDCLVNQMSDSSNMIIHQRKFLSLVKIFVATVNSPLSRTNCLRLLILNAQYTSIGSRYELQWTDELIDVLKLLLIGGADPTWIQDCHHEYLEANYDESVDETIESALYRFLQGVLSILVHKKDLTNSLMELFPLLLTEKCLDHREPKGSMLHALLNMDWQNLPEDLPAEFYQLLQKIVSMVIESNPDQLDLTNEDGKTALHILAKATHNHPNNADKLIPILSLLMTPLNVNARDKESMTPISWIMEGKIRWEDDSKIKQIFSDIEEIFLQCADGDLPKNSSAESILKFIEQEFQDEACTQARLERLLDFMKVVKDWESHSCRMKLNDRARRNLKNISNPRFLSIVMDIVRIMVLNNDVAQFLWHAIFPGNLATVRLSVVEMLSVCAEAGAQPTNEQKQRILSETKVFSRSIEWTLPFLKMLISVNKIKRFACDLSFLGEFHLVPREVVHLGRQLVYSWYKTWEDCLKSGNLIDCFLFMTETILDETTIEKLFYGNWLQRNPLHLAAIYLDSLECLAPRIIEKYLDARDLHGSTPLHVAYLHHNEQAVQFLSLFDTNENAIDQFGLAPKDLGSHDGVTSKNGMMVTVYDESSLPKEHRPDVVYYEHCCRVIESKRGVLRLLKPFLVLSEEEAQNLCSELQSLFERLVKETEFKEAKIQLAGSMREKLKAGQLDEGDVQLQLHGHGNFRSVYVSGVEWDREQFLQQFSGSLIKSLAKINWEGIQLRPICVKGPWKFIREGSNSSRGREVSLDVVVVLVDERRSTKYSCDNVAPKDIHRLQAEILEDAPIHKHIIFSTLETWNDYKGFNMFKQTMFEYEWDMIDCLPTSCRLAIIIAKALIQAYDLSRGDRIRVKMPITSYTVKTALFYLISYNSSQLELNVNDYNDESKMISQANNEALRNALEIVDGENKQRMNRMKYNLISKWLESYPILYRLKSNPHPKWATDEELHQHGEEARVWAWKIFTLIKHLAEEGRKLNNYWDRSSPLREIWDYGGFGEAKYISDVCDCALDHLKPDTF